MDDSLQGFSQDRLAAITENNNLGLTASNETKTVPEVGPLASNTNASALASPQFQGQSQSPISISGSDSAIVSESVVTPKPNNLGNNAMPALPQPNNSTKMSIESTMHEKRGNGQTLDSSAGDNTRAYEKMEVDNPELDKKSENDQQSRISGIPKYDNNELKSDNVDGVTNDDVVRAGKIQNIEEAIDNMENVRLELIPLLLEIVEQVKNGELSIKDVDNACGRVRVRVNRLLESRSLVEAGLQAFEDENYGFEQSQQDVEQRIKLKSNALADLVSAISSRSSARNV